MHEALISDLKRSFMDMRPPTHWTETPLRQSMDIPPGQKPFLTEKYTGGWYRDSTAIPSYYLLITLKKQERQSTFKIPQQK